MKKQIERVIKKMKVTRQLAVLAVILIPALSYGNVDVKKDNAIIQFMAQTSKLADTLDSVRSNNKYQTNDKKTYQRLIRNLPCMMGKRGEKQMSHDRFDDYTVYVNPKDIVVTKKEKEPFEKLSYEIKDSDINEEPSLNERAFFQARRILISGDGDILQRTIFLNEKEEVLLHEYKVSMCKGDNKETVNPLINRGVPGVYGIGIKYHHHLMDVTEDPTEKNFYAMKIYGEFTSYNFLQVSHYLKNVFDEWEWRLGEYRELYSDYFQGVILKVNIRDYYQYLEERDYDSYKGKDIQRRIIYHLLSFYKREGTPKKDVIEIMRPLFKHDPHLWDFIEQKY